MRSTFRGILRSISAIALVSGMALGCAAGDGGSEAQGSSALTEAHYPIVLVHGFFGFKDFAGADFLTYFYNVEADLKAHGETQVFTPALDPFNDSTFRGQQLEARVLEILAQTGAKKVNLIGHSQGGVDARFVAHNRPDLVASVTTIGTAHAGSHLADLVLGVTDIPVVGNLVGDVIDALARVIGAPLFDEIGNETSVVRGVRQLSTDGMREFNAQYTDQPSVQYFSIAGRSADSDGGSDCAANSPGFISKFSRTVDPIDGLLSVPELATSGWPFHDMPNDGFVRVNEARWGTFLGCIPADHLDEVGQLLGASPGGHNTFDYLAFYRDLVGTLRGRGL